MGEATATTGGQPFVVGVAGGTGSGKTTIAQKIAESVPRESVSVIEHDSYYRDAAHLDVEARAQLNFDHPDALDTQLLIEHLQALKSGTAAEVPLYDFKTHARRGETKRVLPTAIIVVEGILIFSDADLRPLLDLKIFVDTDADIRILRRIRRDMEQRGRSFESVREQYYRTVRPMHLQFVEPSKRWADVIVPEGGDNAIALDVIATKLRSVVRQQNALLLDGA